MFRWVHPDDHCSDEYSFVVPSVVATHRRLIERCCPPEYCAHIQYLVHV